MPWVYQQTTATMDDPAGNDSGYRWYAGRGDGKNNHTKQTVKNIGPLPVGEYTMGMPILSSHLGPIVIPLHPAPTNQMFGRYGFYIHFDSVQHPGEASDGCVVVQANGIEAILKIWGSGDHVLQVVA